jgi:glycine betaine/choline ABC-type transport system substrate-binding protein
MMVAHATDGVLTQKQWKKLLDDRHVFVPKQACLLVQQNLLMTQPGVRPALEELSGKIHTEKMRELNASVELGHLQPKNVAAAFLEQLGFQ